MHIIADLANGVYPPPALAALTGIRKAPLNLREARQNESERSCVSCGLALGSFSEVARKNCGGVYFIMAYLLFPGRHLANTAFQSRYLRSVLHMPPAQLTFWQEQNPLLTEPLDQIIFAITSCNRQHSRYNPIPFYVRAIGVDRFARSLEMAVGVGYRIIGIPHYRPTPRFAAYVLKEIEEQTEGNLALTPQNCVVVCSTPAVMALYRDLGFAILPAERGLPPDDRPHTPIALIEQMAAAGSGWRTDRGLRQELAAATFDLWQDFPDVPRRVQRLWRDPLLNDEGGLTDSRDYSYYADSMGNSAVLQLKYNDIKAAIRPGKIVDEGCADGALLALIARDFPDSDLIGIEITGEFMARCRERQRAGEFGGTYVHFHQRNITHPIFEDNSIDTTLCNSTVHELWSYGEGAATVHDYFAKKYAQTRRGGRLIIRDVVGPEAGEQTVYLWLEHRDGRNDDIFREAQTREALAAHLAGLSTYGRFRRFARDFLAAQRAGGRRGPETQIRFRETTIDGERYAILSLRAAVEFMSKKDYTTNWNSEMNEEFAFWGFSRWKAALQQAGFHVIENPNAPAEGSRVYTNPWIVDNRYEGKVKLFRQGENGRLRPLPYPPTNIVLIGVKTGRDQKHQGDPHPKRA